MRSQVIFFCVAWLDECEEIFLDDRAVPFFDPLGLWPSTGLTIMVEE
jgi:hypothetical protein